MRDAIEVWRSWMARPWAAALLTLAFAAPLLSGVVGRIVRGRSFFAEYESIACAGERANAGLAYYGADFACAGMNAQPFVYLPWVAEAAAAALRLVGPDGLRAIYLAIYLVAVALLAWLVFLRADTPGKRIDRIPFLALITGSALTVGNIAIPIAALVAIAALSIVQRPLIFILIVAAAGAIKPFQLTFLALLPIALSGGLLRRGAYSAFGAVLGLGVFFAAAQVGGPALEGWRAEAQRMALSVAPGEGFLGWASLMQAPLASPGMIGAYLVFAAILGLAAIWIAEAAKLDKEPRIWLGLAVATLLTPRLMQIDFLLLGPGLLVVAAAAAQAGRGAGALASWAMLGGAFAALLLGIADAGDYALKVATAAFTLGIVATAWGYLRQSTARR